MDKLLGKSIISRHDEFPLITNLGQNGVLHFINEVIDAIIDVQRGLAGFVELSDLDKGVDIDSHYQKKDGQIADYDAGEYGQSHRRLPFKVGKLLLPAG
jgi:hypothetical protein